MITIPPAFTTAFLPATEVGLQRTNVTLPAFSVAAPAWKGASEIVRQYNYTASTNFYLSRRPAKPAGVNYGLCIRFRVGDTVYRYKLWEDDDLILGDLAAPLYDSNVIKANFVLEVWSLEGEATLSQAAAITIFTSIRAAISDLRASMTATALAYSEVLTYADLTFEGTPYNTFPDLAALVPPTPDLAWYKGSAITEAGGPAIVTGWPDTSAADHDLDTITGAGFKVAPAGWNSNYLLQVPIGFEIYGSDPTYGPSAVSYVVFQQNTFVDNAYLFTLACNIQVTQETTSGTIRLISTQGAPPECLIALQLNTKYIMRCEVSQVGANIHHQITVYDLATLAVVAETSFDKTGIIVDDSGSVSIGSSGNSALAYVAEILEYSTTQNYAAVLAYLQQKYNGSVQFAASGTFNAGNMWEDNS